MHPFLAVQFRFVSTYLILIALFFFSAFSLAQTAQPRYPINNDKVSSNPKFTAIASSLIPGVTYNIIVSEQPRGGGAGIDQYIDFWIKEGLPAESILDTNLNRIGWDSTWVRKTRNGNYVGAATVVPNATPASLPYGKTYYWHIYASNVTKSVENTFSTLDNRRMVFANSPANGAVVDASAGEPCFTWNIYTQSNFGSYTVMVSTTPDFPSTRWQYQINSAATTSICWNNGSGWTPKGSTPPATPGPLQNGVTYYWRVLITYSDGAILNRDFVGSSFNYRATATNSSSKSSIATIFSSSVASSSKLSSSSAQSINLSGTASNFIQSLNQTAPVNPAADSMTESIYNGALGGSHSVGPDGSFNYSLPLSIPVGINGVQPKLQLNYNSNAKNGLLGWGWTLGGLSVIGRCNASMVRDGYVSGIQAGDNYKYCIDGQRLVEVATGEYRTESESFLRVKKMGDYWEVTNNVGIQSRYGFNTDSKLEDDQSQTYAWYLDQQKDVSNNSWSVIYSKSSSGGHQSHYPDSITYTSNPLLSAMHSVKFYYENREDISVKYVAGMKVKNDKRLSKIELKSSSVTIHTYNLAYQQAGQMYHGKQYSDPAKTSRLASVKKCIGNSLTDCAKPVEFDWNLQTVENYRFSSSGLNQDEGSSTVKVYLDINGDGRLEPYFGGDSTELGNIKYRKADVNRDGFEDVIKENKLVSGVTVYLSNGTSIESTPASSYGKSVSDISYSAIRTWSSYINQSNSPPATDSSPNVYAYETEYADINGDGLIDLIRYPYSCYGSTVWCKFDSSAAKDISIAFNTGTGFGAFISWYSNWAGPSPLCPSSAGPAFRDCQLNTFKLNFVDIDGDGTIDFYANTAYPRSNGTYEFVIVGLNNGKDGFTIIPLGKSIALNNYLGDFNGDGRIDIVKMPSYSSDRISVKAGIGKMIAAGDELKGFTSFSIAEASGSNSGNCAGIEPISNKCRYDIFDFNNDGMDDIVETSTTAILAECRDATPVRDSCWNYVHRVTAHTSRVYLSLGANAEGNIIFSAPVNISDLPLLQSVGADTYTRMSLAKRRVDDFNNDGNQETDARLKNNVKSNRIESIIEASGRINIAYDSLLSQKIYQYTTDAAAQDLSRNDNSYSLISSAKVIGKRFGVREIQVSNGAGSTNKSEYIYKGSKTHGSGYGDLGFAQVEVLDTVAGKTPIKTITRYYQSADTQYKLAGRVRQQLVYTSNSSGALLQKLSDTRNQWKVRIYSDDIDTAFKSPHYFSYLYKSSSQQWDLDGTKIANSQTQNQASATASCDELVESPSIVVTNAGSAADNDYSADGVLLFSQTAMCDQSGSSASVQINALENLDVTSKGNARALVQKRKAYAWVGSAVASATKSAYDVRTQSFAYNSLGQLETKTIEPELASPNNFKVTSTYLYNGFGSVRKITEAWDDAANDGLDITTRETNIIETFDSSGARQVETTKPLGLKETTKFHPVFGVPTSEIDVNGLETKRFYDAQGRPSSIVYADATNTQIDYRQCNSCSGFHSAAVWYKQVKTTGSSAVRTYYDGFNREIGGRTKGLNGLDTYTVQTYNSRGGIYQVSAPFFSGGVQQTTTRNYDDLGRISTINFPDNSSEIYTYNGLRHATTNRLNQTQNRYLNAAGWVIRSVDNANTPIDFTYWPWGDLKTSQVNNDPKTLVNVVYDKLGRKTEMTDPNTGKTSYTYNSLGLMATQTDAKNQRTCFGYDALERQTKRIDNASSSCSGTTQSWSYDTKTYGKGQLASLNGINTDGSGYSEQYSYTNMGLPQATTYSYGGNSYTITSSYDSFSRPLATTYPTGYVVANRYNSYGHMSEIIDSANTRVWKANDADAQGNLKQFTLGNDVVTNQTFDPFYNRIETIQAVKGNLVIQDQRYKFDAIGNLKSREDRKNTLTQSLCYDGLNRLKAARFTGCSSANNDFTYDSLGNLATKEGMTGTLGYGTNGSNVAGPHAVTSANGWSYKYDAIGNLETATKSGQLTRTVQYSPFNKPVSITQGSKFSTIVYGPNQDRIKHSDSNGRVTNYVGGIYEEVTKDGVTQKIHYVGDVALFISKGSNTNATYSYEYQHRDHIGSLVALSKGAVNSASDVQWQANGTWGERRYQQWNGPLDNLLIPASTARGFTDHEHLDSVGLIHMNGRVYDPELGRFLSADPFVQAPYNSQSYNRYSYVFNNPLSFTDPSGYECFQQDYFVNGQKQGSDWISSNGTLCGQDAIVFGQDWKIQQERQNQSWEYVIQNFQASYWPQSFQSNGYATGLAIPIEGNAFAGAGCGIAGICLGDSVEDSADLAAAEKVVGKHAMTAATVIGMIVGPAKAKSLARIANPVPKTLARVVPGNIDPKTLGTTPDVFVTDAKVLKGLNANQIAEKLTIPQSLSGFKIIEFSSKGISGIASPINRTNPGFIGGGKTAGGAPEFVMPNGPIPVGSTWRVMQ
ncbi:polymorphic toxin type 10 domain-containing protein [Cellvibrio mixtus]|uniref:polymorphic toxin type 10 domain-containing protein n=1 Tax=Cellvibrio mixtus TaxID=39650 RepID=UPI000586A7EE|nr:polymorphic toxin type 10 domain-containing protein [Cellvibrio mixtus]